VLSLQAILLTSSLLIVLGMVGALAWLAALGIPEQPEAISVEPAKDLI